MNQLDEISARLAENLQRAKQQGDLFKAGVEQNLQALIKSQLERLELVTRDDFEAQQAALRQALARVDALEADLARLEALLQAKE
jgi:BMFP domain-containing protein YqiC